MPEIHVQVRLASTFPSADELASRHALERALGGDVGHVTGAGAGGGVMELWVWAQLAEAALERIDEIVTRLGLADRTKVTLKAPQVKVRITCDEDVFPEGDELAPRDALERALELSDIGQVTGVGAEIGCMDLWREVQDVTVAVARIDAIVKQLGIADRTSIEGR